MAADETELQYEQSRTSAARLLESLAEKMGGSRAVRQAADYVHSHTVADVGAGVNQYICRRPLQAIMAAMLAGFLVSRALLPRRSR